MRKLILASKSPARRALLKQAGLKFLSFVPNIKEKKSNTGGVKKLVIDNAFKKAQAAANKFTSGIVIGADTLSLVKGKVIGKPKNKAHAFRILKQISGKPQWVYTGLVIIDIDKRKVYKAHEKTKVYMRKLSNFDIKAYLKKVNTIDKAGSFDIQGLGSTFIYRIEGCFYNVVGLPLARLGTILEKIGVNLF